MDVNVLFIELRKIQFQRRSLAPQIGQRRLRALLHHFAEGAGQQQLAGAGHARGLDKQDVAAHRCPGQADRNA